MEPWQKSQLNNKIVDMEEINQTLEQNKEIFFTQRVSIFHNGDSMMSIHSGRVLKVDNRLLYRENRFSNIGEENMIKFANRCGYKDIRSFFDHYKKLTNGEDYYGIIRFTDGFRWFLEEDIKNDR